MRTELENFKESLIQKLDEQGYAAVPEVLTAIESSGYAYNKSDFKILWANAYVMQTALNPGPYIVQLKLFIGTLEGLYDKRIRMNIPFRPGFFIGRAGRLTEIHTKLTGAAAQKNNILLITGTGGMGKTTLMQEYLYQTDCREHFNIITVISVNNNLEHAFITGMAATFDIDWRILKTDDHLTYIVTQMQNSPGNNLVVIDNINQEDFEQLVDMRSTFQQTGWSILITSRAEPVHFHNIIRIDELDTGEAVILFSHHYVPDEIDKYNIDALNVYIDGSGLRSDIESLLAHIVRHTLLTELLAKVGKKRGFSVKALHEFLLVSDTSNPELQTLIEIGMHAANVGKEKQKEQKIHAYLLNMFETEYMEKETGDRKVDIENKAKVIMLHFFSVLPSDDIPIEDLKKLWRVEAGDVITFEQRLDEIKQIGWIHGKQLPYRLPGMIQNLFYKMHFLVQKVVYEKLKPDVDSCRPLIKTITEVLSQVIRHPERFQQYAKSVIGKIDYLNDKYNK